MRKFIGFHFKINWTDITLYSARPVVLRSNIKVKQMKA